MFWGARDSGVTDVTIIGAMVNKDLSGEKLYDSTFSYLIWKKMTFSLWKLGLQQMGLTVIKIISCLFADIQNLFIAFVCSEL